MVSRTTSAVTADRYRAGRRASPDVLPDEVLLHIFRFCRVDTMDRVNETWGWLRLVHVCARWRRVILDLPQTLGLRLVCTEKTPVRRTLDVWPPFPIIIEYRNTQPSIQVPENGFGSDLATALQQHARVQRITVCGLSSSLLETIASTMLKPFPALTHLQLESCGDPNAPTPVVPDGLLGGLAPSLKRIWLEGVQFQSLPTVLSSANHLIELRLDKIPDSWDISPEALASALSPLTSLISLTVEFQSPRLFRTAQNPPPLTRTRLPALTMLFFKGVSEYFEDLVSRIDAPRLEYCVIKFYNQLLFDISHLPEFFARAEKLRSLDRAEVFFDNQGVGIGLHLPETTVPRNVTLRILCSPSDWQLSSLAQVCHQSSSLLSRVERLDIRECPSKTREPKWQDKTQWVDLFRPFAAMTALHIPRELGPRIAPVLQELAQPRAADVLPELKWLIFEDLKALELSGPLRGAIQEFTAARASTGHRVGVRQWEVKWERDLQWEWNLAREWARDLEVGV
jgi:hypothetical protein